MKKHARQELESGLEYVSNLIKALLVYHESYFSSGYLNSEGWKVIGVIAKVLSRRGIYVQDFLRKIRTNPNYDNVANTLNTLLEYLKNFRANQLSAE